MAENTLLKCTLKLMDFATLEGVDFSADVMVKTSRAGMSFNVLMQNALSDLYLKIGKMANPFAGDYNSFNIHFDYDCGYCWDDKCMFTADTFTTALKDAFMEYKKTAVIR